MSAALSVTDLHLSFGGNKVLQNVNLEVGEGELLAVIGPNGAGKTSLFNILTRHYTPDSGAVSLFGRSLLNVKAHRLPHFGMMRTFQNVLLLRDMTVLDNVLIGLHASFAASYLSVVCALRSSRVEEAERKALAMDALRLVGLDNCADRTAGSLSLGHQRLLEIARCIAIRPRIILLDEPSAGMSSEEVHRLTETIERVRGDLSLTVVLIAHTMRLVVELSDRIAVLDHGVKIADGPPDSVMRDPVVVRAYLGGSNELAPA